MSELFDSCEKDFQQCLSLLEHQVKHPESYNLTSMLSKYSCVNIINRQSIRVWGGSEIGTINFIKLTRVLCSSNKWK